MRKSLSAEAQTSRRGYNHQGASGLPSAAYALPNQAKTRTAPHRGFRTELTHAGERKRRICRAWTVCGNQRNLKSAAVSPVSMTDPPHPEVGKCKGAASHKNAS